MVLHLQGKVWVSLDINSRCSTGCEWPTAATAYGNGSNGSSIYSNSSSSNSNNSSSYSSNSSIDSSSYNDNNGSSSSRRTMMSAPSSKPYPPSAQSPCECMAHIN